MRARPTRARLAVAPVALALPGLPRQLPHARARDNAVLNCEVLDRAAHALRAHLDGPRVGEVDLTVRNGQLVARRMRLDRAARATPDIEVANRNAGRTRPDGYQSGGDIARRRLRLRQPLGPVQPRVLHGQARGNSQIGGIARRLRPVLAVNDGRILRALGCPGLVNLVDNQDFIPGAGHELDCVARRAAVRRLEKRLPGRAGRKPVIAVAA